MSVIATEKLERLYAPARGLLGVSLSVEAGQCYAILGPNGSGKTTLTRLLVGLEKPTSGRLAMFGQVIDHSRDHLAQCGYAGDTAVHWENLTGRQNAWFVGESYGLPADRISRRLEELLELSDLTSRADDPVATYSFGMRRKLSIVQALLPDPGLLILDEPTSGLDVQFQDRLAELIRQRCKDGLTTWLSGNDPEFVAKAASHATFLDQGAIVAEATVEAMLAELSPLSEMSIRLASSATISVPQMDRIESFQQDNDMVRVLLRYDPEVIAEVIGWIGSHGGHIVAIEISRPTLRGAYLAKTGKRLES